MKLFNLFTRKPSPPPQVLDVAAARERALWRDAEIKAKAKLERIQANAEYKAAYKARDTRRQHKAAKRVRRATDRCLELGV